MEEIELTGESKDIVSDNISKFYEPYTPEDNTNIPPLGEEQPVSENEGDKMRKKRTLKPVICCHDLRCRNISAGEHQEHTAP